ncbi:MAG: hypothetical protein AAGM67_17600, partial [Bacteroidota bacterium]
PEFPLLRAWVTDSLTRLNLDDITFDPLFCIEQMYQLEAYLDIQESYRLYRHMTALQKEFYDLPEEDQAQLVENTLTTARNLTCTEEWSTRKNLVNKGNVGALGKRGMMQMPGTTKVWIEMEDLDCISAVTSEGTLPIDIEIISPQDALCNREEMLSNQSLLENGPVSNLPASTVYSGLGLCSRIPIVKELLKEHSKFPENGTEMEVGERYARLKEKWPHLLYWASFSPLTAHFRWKQRENPFYNRSYGFSSLSGYIGMNVYKQERLKARKEKH